MQDKNGKGETTESSATGECEANGAMTGDKTPNNEITLTDEEESDMEEDNTTGDSEPEGVECDGTSDSRTSSETVSQGTQTSIPITSRLRGPLEGRRSTRDTLCYDSYIQIDILEADFACQIEGTGTFCFFAEEPNCHLYLARPGGAGRRWCHWTMRELGVLANDRGCEGDTTGMIPLTESVLAILYEGRTCLHLRSVPNSGWLEKVRKTFFDFDDVIRPKSLMEATLPTLNTSCQFSKLRGYGAEDFKIICNDDKELLAHSIVLASRWDTIHNILIDSPEKNSHSVPFDSSWIEPVILHCYGEEPKSLDLVTATGVALAAYSFNMPELLVFALRRIKQESTEISTNLKAWKMVRTYVPPYTATSNSIRDYLACRIQEQLSVLAGSKESQELLKDMNKPDLIELYNNLSENIGAEEERRKNRRGMS